MDKFANMQAFALVGQTESFAEAARRLNLANSVVSKRIKDLEGYLGTQLLVRTTRKVTLTEAGYTYMEFVRKTLDELEEVEASLLYQTENPVGTIRISVPLSFGMQYLGAALSSYMEKYPDVNVKAYLSDRRVDLIEDGFDVALRLGALEDSSLVAKKLAHSRLVLCASPEYLQKYGRPQAPLDLREHNCLSYLNLAEGKAWPFMVDGKMIWQPISGRFASDNGDLLFQSAMEGSGLVLLPIFIVGEAVERGELEILLQDYERDDFNLYAVYQHTRHLSIKVRTLIDHLHSYFKDALTCALL